MRILMLAHALRAGGGRATCTNILNALRNIDHQNEYCIVVPDQPEYRALKLEHTRWEVHYFRHRFWYLGRVLFDTLTRNRTVRRFHPDVIWAMGGLGLSNPPCP